jgi:hypothetical protein
MSARKDMARLLEEWLQLTQAEGAAIQSAAWSAVKEIQARKTELQKSLAEAELNWAAENPGDTSGVPAPKPFRTEVGRLISLEARNAELLAAQLRRARAQQEALDQAYRNLRKIQRSYARKPLPTAWQCYS